MDRKIDTLLATVILLIIVVITSGIIIVKYFETHETINETNKIVGLL